MTTPEVRWTVDNGVATLTVHPGDDPHRLAESLSATVASIFADPVINRIEVLIPAPDRPARHALHVAGFRREGLLRARFHRGDALVDQLCYALLREDEIQGRAGFTAVMNSVTPRKRAIAHLLVTDAAGQVCVLETTFKPDFELPGGILEPGESPRQGLAREVFEELQTSLPVHRLLVVDWLAPFLGWEDALELIFDAGVITDPDRLHPDGQEIRAVHWLEPHTALDTMAPYARGRLAAALNARQSGDTYYLEAGSLIS